MAPGAPGNPKLKCEKTLFTYCSSSSRTSTSLPAFKIFSFKIDVISQGPFGDLENLSVAILCF